MRAMIPEPMLPLVLDRFFPVISGPDELHRAVELVEARAGEFCASLRIDSEMVAKVCRFGFLPMSEDFSGHELLLVKVHEDRCLLDPEELHVSKSTRRRSRGLELAIDHEFDGCLDAIVAHHPQRWLTDRLCESIRTLHRAPRHGVAMHSVEVYDGARLVAGEIGYTCGAVYTSLSGFHRVSGTGAVQLATLGVILRDAGFVFWDLGMVIEYKLELGARVFGRHEFLELYRQSAQHRTPDLTGRAECRDVLRRAPGYSSTG